MQRADLRVGCVVAKDGLVVEDDRPYPMLCAHCPPSAARQGPAPVANLDRCLERLRGEEFAGTCGRTG
ncbi:hypothetical protein GCM10027168_73270 [Streptomyces capparidis]